MLGLADVFPQDAYPFPRDDISARWLGEIADPAIQCFVVDVDGVVQGFAAIRGDEFLHFGVTVEQWGSGLARRAHDEVLARMRHAGVRTAWLRVFAGNGRGRRFYENLGWTLTGERSLTSFPPYPELLHYARTL
ncbi:GCN5-related N-acetyltransferase [Xylanimonas cellulosilytica DSM 15894]|uniref:GCN5-related N-acetyltransferase n=1 Tax=Xylanimonas cellulosilytica (strain DSM 15894 / JCM 12276 / CECT 5975 / KCTC 9989 / LMG 20990 / NBRC 107835 / XIL07) TaxID=446471 RepID=D1BSE2_XYLCX|nr:GCN5-related N-acetyltransferase [Xylanimonas cellulosilytica DSM 15894]